MAINNTNTPRDVGLMGHIFWFVIKLIGWSFLGWLTALVLSTALLTFMGKQIGIRYLDQLINSQLNAIGVMPTLLSNIPVQTAEHAMNTVGHTLFIKTHIIDWFTQWKNEELTQDKTFKYYLSISYQYLGDYVKAWILTTQLTVLRLVIAFLMLPLFLLLGLVGFVDGLVQRDLRRFSGGRESALIYHRAKRYIVPTLMAGYFIYLILPLPLPPQCVFLPTAILFGMVIAITTSRFKKYV